MYWQLEDAVKALKIRQGDLELLKKVNEFVGDCPIPEGHHGFLVRHVATARIEDLEFEKRCREAGLLPVVLTFNDDIFVSNNPSKTRLVQLRICEKGNTKDEESQIQRIDLLGIRDLSRIQKTPISQIRTAWGEPLIEFHLRTRALVGLSGQVIDFSVWLKSIGRAKEYYKYLLAACLTRGILFESFESPGFPNLDIFKSSVVLPALREINERFDVQPLIVKHPDTNSAKEEKKILNWYPSVIRQAIPKEFLL